MDKTELKKVLNEFNRIVNYEISVSNADSEAKALVNEVAKQTHIALSEIINLLD